MKLSVTLATYNEEANLARCLESVQKIADEIIIVDGQSIDETVKIAKTFNVKIKIVPNQANFHINKQLANDMATGDWILQLDADEVVSQELATEISQLLNSTQETINTREINPDKKSLFQAQQAQIEARDGAFPSDQALDVVAFFLPRKNWFLNRFLTHAGVYPDGVIRLFKNHQARLPAKNVHEQYEVDGRVSWLNQDLLHFDSPTFERYFQRNARYAKLFASQLSDQKLPINLFTAFQYMLWIPFSTFFSLFLRHSGWRDGFPGFVWCYYSALTWSQAYVRYWEERHKHEYEF